MNGDLSLQRLNEIKHIVVLMMENRSFDQMLGYLMRDGMPDVRGLTGSESNPDADGNQVAVFEWGPDQTVFRPAQDHSGKILDPCHSKECVHAQLADENRGFVKNFLATRTDDHGNRVSLPPEYQRLPMGYYAAQHLPAYDFLARNYCVCDSWHSSVPGDTWPNRLFALAGREGPLAVQSVLDRIAGPFQHLAHLIEKAPIYDVQAFTRELANEQWRWYSHDPATLRAADERYRHPDGIDRSNFAFFDRQRMSILTRLLEEPVVDTDSFLDDAARGRLREVSWIDPNFCDLNVLDPNSNDDHPPSDIRRGQELVLEVYEALRNSRDWEDTLLVIIYDEHGGFYDHVVPPKLPFDDGSGYPSYGVRVPALIVGPRVKQQVCHTLFDHTSLIKTILLRFAADPSSAIASMGARVAGAEHLGSLLAATPRADIRSPTDAHGQIAAWREQARATRRGVDAGAAPAADGAGHPMTLHHFQEDMVRLGLAMRAIGLPHGEP